MRGEWFRLGVGGIVPVTWDLAAKSSGGPGELEGWASVYNVVDQQDDIVVPGAFKKTLAEAKASGRVIPLSKDHALSVDSVIGSLNAAEETPYGLKIRAGFASTKEAQDARTKAAEGHLRGLSIFGPIIQKAMTVRAGKEIRVLKELGLLQVALTAYPANLVSVLTAAKSAIAVHHTAVVDQAWDAGGEVAKANTEAEYRHMFAILRDGQPADQKGSYALPHHTAGTDSPAVLSAVRNALARLPQTQGLSDAERAAAEAHLRAHLDDASSNSASASLDPAWEADMRAALTIRSAPVRKAAIESLIVAQFPTLAVDDPPVGDTDPSTVDDGHNDTSQDDAAAYALALIGESGPGQSPPGGEPNPSLADLEALAGAGQTSLDIDRLAAEIGGLL